MFKNYFVTALRNFKKNSLTTLINVLGLSIGISAALIIFLVVQYDYSFDTYQPGRERIYRIIWEVDQGRNQGNPAPLHQIVRNNVSGIECLAPIFGYVDNPKVSIPQGNGQTLSKFRKQDNIVFTDSNYFRLFPHLWLAGDKSTALQYVYSVVLSESRAKMYFPNIPADQVIGKVIIFSDSVRTVVSGVVKDLAANSDFEHKVIISMPTISETNLKSDYYWGSWLSIPEHQTLIKLLPGVQPEEVTRQINIIYKKYVPTETFKRRYMLQPLSDVHTNTEVDGKVNERTLHYLVLLVIFLLLLGAINFINLSTAQAVQRAKEIGIRKTLGSSKSWLILQFLTETFLLTLLAAFLAVVIAPLLLSAFADFIPEGLQFDNLFKQPSLLLFLLILITVVSILAGLYPAFILTRFQPVQVLKNQIVSGSNTRSVWVRKTLIVCQFVIAQVFIVAMMVVDKQIHYSMQKDMGFRKEAIISFWLPDKFYEPNETKFVLRDELRRIPEVQQVSLGTFSPAFNFPISNFIEFKENGKELKLDVNGRNGDTAYLGVYNLKLVAGRNVLPRDNPTELLINESLAKQLQFKRPADALGHTIYLKVSHIRPADSLGNGHSWEYVDTPLPIVGVMADFNSTSVRTSVQPLIFYSQPQLGLIFHVSLQPDPATWKTAIAKIQATWKKILPDEDFDYAFFDKQIGDFYKEDRQLSLLLTWSAGVAIFISCLGLLGLVIFITNQRTKEIGIRKVLGATVTQIITLLSSDFAKLLLLAFVIATPIAWWLTHGWLQNFAYHTDLSLWVFVLSGVIMITIALAILCIRAGRTASANPVKSLRTE